MPLKRISVFFLVSLVLYGVFIVPWPGVMDGYRWCFRKAGTLLLGSIGDSGTVAFEALPATDHAADTRLVLRNRRAPGANAPFPFKASLVGYRPTIFLLALVLATPIAWSRRWRALLWGLLWVNVFVAFRVWLLLVNAFSNENPLAVYSFSPFFKSLFEPLVAVMFLSPATHYTAPAFIWLLVTFRRGDIEALLGSKRSGPARR